MFYFPQEVFDLLVAKNGTVKDLIPILQKKANLSDETIQAIRFFEAHNNKFYKELSEDFAVVSITDFVTLYAESIPEEERNADQGFQIIYGFHFDKEPNKPHGVPFKFIIKPVSLSGDFLAIANSLFRENLSKIPRSGCPEELASKESSLKR